MSGQESRGFKCVLATMDTIISHLRVNSAAKEALIIKYKKQRWLDAAETLDETGLVTLVQGRISIDAGQYDIFIEMLRDIAGADLIVKKLKETYTSLGVSLPQMIAAELTQTFEGAPNAIGKSHTLEELRQDFKNIKAATCDGVIQKCGNSTRDLVGKIMNLPAPLQDKSDKMFLHQHADNIEESRSTRAVFHRIGLHWDYLNPDVYDYLIKTYSLNDLIEPMEEYRGKLDIFTQQISLQEFSDIDGPKDSSAPPPGFKELITKHNWNPKITPLKKAIDFQKNSASMYGVRECAVWLANIGEGCVSITLLVPDDALQAIKTATPNFFQTHDIVHVELERKCLYQKSSDKTENFAAAFDLSHAPTGDELLTPDDAVNVLEEIQEAENQSYVLGLKLNLPPHILESIYEGYSQPRNRLLQVLIEFTNQVEPRPTWRTILTALRSPTVNLPRLAMIMEAAHCAPPSEILPATAESPQSPPDTTTRSLADMPKLPELLSFETFSGSSVTQEIGRHFSILGPLLLNDDTGAVTSAIVSQYQRDAALINQEILTKWLQGKGKHPMTWSTLIAVLRDVGLLTLAQKIEEDIIKTQIQELETKNTEWHQQVEKDATQLHKTEEDILEIQRAIREKEKEKEKLVQAKDREIAEAQKQLRLLRQQEQSSRKKIMDLKRQLQSSEALVAELKKNIQRKNSVVLIPKVKGPGLESATANHPTHVIVEITDASNRPYSVPQKVTAELELISEDAPTSSSSPAVHAAVSYTSPSQYMVSYTAISRGQHKLHVRLDGNEIPDSPFTMTVYPDPTQLAHPVRIVKNLVTPYSIAFNSRGEMVITEKLLHQISIFDNTDTRIHTFGSPGDNKENMILPQGIAIDEKDNIYVSSNSKLQKFTSRGELIAFADDFRDPYGVTLYNNDVYVCDCNNHCIRVFDMDLNFIRSIGSYGKKRGQFNTPYDVSFDRDGLMYVAEWGNERVQVMDTSGHFIRVFGEEEDGKLLRPSTLNIVDKYVYVSDYSGGCIVVYETSGEFVAKFGGWGQKAGEFIYPYCISSSSDGYIYVCDRENGRVQIF